MFSTAYATASEYTFPITISWKHYNGECHSGMGAFVVINDDGWALTANHIIEMVLNLAKEKLNYEKLVQERQKIENDTTLKKHIQMSRLAALKIPAQSITNFSPHIDGLGKIGTCHFLPEADIAAFQIVGFDKARVNRYPVFKDPNLPMPFGTSLCKLGYPFHTINPTFDEATSKFDLPPGSYPPPRFPIEGIYTRNHPAPSVRGIPIQWLETSTPGLKGQSGGPTFDVNGNIWAIQARTKSINLGFGQNAKGSKEAEHMRNQFFNVGIGTHAMTVTNFLTAAGIKFQTTTY